MTFGRVSIPIPVPLPSKFLAISEPSLIPRSWMPMRPNGRIFVEDFPAPRAVGVSRETQSGELGTTVRRNRRVLGVAARSGAEIAERRLTHRNHVNKIRFGPATNDSDYHSGAPTRPIRFRHARNHDASLDGIT